MRISEQWLRTFVDPPIDTAALAERLTMSGLNLESIEPKGKDFAVDLEVTSNRPDCLGHLGIAREVGVLASVPVSRPLKMPSVLARASNCA